MKERTPSVRKHRAHSQGSSSHEIFPENSPLGPKPLFGLTNRLDQEIQEYIENLKLEMDSYYRHGAERMIKRIFDAVRN